MEFCGIHVTTILQELLNISVHEKKSENHIFKIAATSLRVNKLKQAMYPIYSGQVGIICGELGHP